MDMANHVGWSSSTVQNVTIISESNKEKTCISEDYNELFKEDGGTVDRSIEIDNVIVVEQGYKGWRCWHGRREPTAWLI
jgi:hypothetical protein